MTTVIILKSHGYIKSVELIGHANYASSGPDIVCAAISMATHMTILGLEEVARAKFTSNCEFEGYMKIEVDEPFNDRVDTLMKTLELALSTLSSQYPENIQIYSC